MKTKRTNIIIIIFLVVIVAVLLLMLLFEGGIPMNPAGTVGNTAGNLNNSGLFCEYDGKVYFSNSYDSGSLYSMTPDEGSLQKLNSLEVRNILAGGDFLYYFRVGTSGDTGMGNVRIAKSFNRCRLDGSDTVGLTRDTVVTAQLVDNYLYMLTSGDAEISFYKLKIDKSEQVMLADYEINPACAENGAIYYNGTLSEHYLYRLDTATDTPGVVWQGNLWYPVKQGDYIYYMDVAENYRLCRYSLTQNIVEVLTNDRIECFNVGGGYVYYQCGGESPALKCMLTDGSGVQVIAEGNFTNINMTSRFVYFQEFGNDSTTFHSSLGSSSYGTFDAAKELIK